jgi:hypothetical protein
MPAFEHVIWLRFVKSKLASLGLLLQPHANLAPRILNLKEDPGLFEG